MNKTLKTVLITLASTFVVLFAVVMIFGEDTSAHDGSAEPKVDAPSVSQAVPSEAPASEAAPAVAAPVQSPDVALTDVLLESALGYDIFSWNMADTQGKTKIVQEIMRVWDAAGSYYAIPEEALVAYIGQNLYDQANIFEVACTAVQIDPLPFFELLA